MCGCICTLSQLVRVSVLWSVVVLRRDVGSTSALEVLLKPFTEELSEDEVLGHFDGLSFEQILMEKAL